jgi:hypothetical protein
LIIIYYELEAKYKHVPIIAKPQTNPIAIEETAESHPIKPLISIHIHKLRYQLQRHAETANQFLDEMKWKQNNEPDNLRQLHLFLDILWVRTRLG